MIIVLIVNLYTSRVILNTLGVEDFGIYNTVAGFVSLFGFFNSTLSGSVQRFYNYEGTKNGDEGFTQVYVTSIIIHALLAAILLIILETLGLWYVNNIMVVPECKLGAANALFQFSVISMILIIFQIPFTGAIMAYERMDFYAVVSIIDVFLKLVVALIINKITGNALIVYGFLLLGVTATTTFLYIVYSKKNFSSLKFYFKINKPLLKSMLSFSGWNLLGTFAYMLKGQGQNMVLNYFFGPIINAARGVASQVNGAINGFAANITIAFRPQMVNSYANNDIEKARQLMFLESKVCFMMMLVLMTPVIFEMDFLLKLWLGNSIPEHTNNFTILILIDALICTLNAPCTQIAYSIGKMKWYQIITSCINLSLIPITILFMKLGYCAEYAFILTIIITIINQSACLILLNKLFPLNLRSYLYDVLLPCVFSLIAIPSLLYMLTFLLNEGFIRLFLIVIADIVVGLSFFYFIMLKRNERVYVINLVRKVLLKHRDCNK